MATGLNFQTQTIINSNKDLEGGKLFEGKDNSLLVKYLNTFFNEGSRSVVNIRKAKGHAGTDEVVTIKGSDLLTLVREAANGTAYCRMDIYAHFVGSEPGIGANPFESQKGIPFWVEFTVKQTDTAAKVVKAIQDQIKKSHVFQIDKDVIKASADSDNLVLTANMPYLHFRKVDIMVFNDAVGDDKVAELGDDAVQITTKGIHEFGTYSQIVKDLRLPTAPHLRNNHILALETPILGATYDQYIFDYVSPANNDGLACVGNKLTSTTQHVFWVKNDADLIAEWETALGAVGTVPAAALVEDAPVKDEAGKL